jgi:hypothetical protein
MRLEQFPVAAGGDLRQHLDDRDPGADFVEETGELQADVAAAHDGEGFRHAVRSKTVLESSTRSDPMPGIGGTAGREPVASSTLAVW